MIGSDKNSLAELVGLQPLITTKLKKSFCLAFYQEEPPKGWFF